MPNLRRSLVINFVSSSGATLIQFIVNILLARMLSPSEVGIFSMTVVFVNIAHIFREFGVSTYLQSEPELSAEKLRAATGVLFTTSWSIATLLFIGSNWIAGWFHEPQMAPVMKVLALGFIVIPIGSITLALLTREYEAGKQAIVNILGTIAFCVTCLVLANLGYGAMSMAWANLANILVSAIACIPLRPKNLPWMPSFRKWRKVFHFGAGTLLSNCLSAINNALPDLLLGKLGSASHVGLFSRASSTVSIFTYVAGTTVTYGSLSYFSQAHHRGEPVSRIMNHAIALLTGVGWPALALTYVLGHDIVLALYGPKWLEAVPAIPALALSAAILMVFNYTSIALTALGRPYLSAVPVVVTLLTRLAFGYALFNGTLSTFAWTICAATVASAPVMIMQHKKYLNHYFSELLHTLWPSAIVTAVCMAAAKLFQMMLPSSLPALSVLLVMALPLAAVWYIALRLTQHPMADEVHQLIAGVRARLA